MLDKAKEKNLFKNYYYTYLFPDTPTEIERGGFSRLKKFEMVFSFFFISTCWVPSDSYDGIIVVAGFHGGMMKLDVCKEFIRILKPGNPVFKLRSYLLKLNN